MNNLTFDTKKSAIKYLSSVKGLSKSNNAKYFYPTGTYHLSHGEYSQPDYEPRRYRDGWGIHVTYYYLSGTSYAPQDGRIDSDTFYNRFFYEIFG